MIHRYKRDAAEEMHASVGFYEDRQPGLGGEFLDELDIAIQTIKQAPQRWVEIDEGVRQYRLDRFPFHLVYEVKDSILVIVAVAHQHRRPGYWKNRLNE